MEKENISAIAFYEKQGFKNIGTKEFKIGPVKMSCFVMEKTT
ncbi:MAG: hypothetical protein ACREHC_05155 [Candidatus Levyibacteriota bacterium]